MTLAEVAETETANSPEQKGHGPFFLNFWRTLVFLVPSFLRTENALFQAANPLAQGPFERGW